MPSDHFDGKKFFTPGAPPVKGFADVLRWMLTRTPARWQLEKPVAQSIPPAQVSEGLRVTFINHSTVLIQTAGINILTDPIWSERASPLRFAGPQRFAKPGVALEHLPPIHIVLLSHNHYDHMDLATLKLIQQQHAPRVYVGLKNASYIAPAGMKRVVEMDWWDSNRYSDATKIHCTPAQHFSGRGISDRNRALWCSFMIESPAGNIYFGADSGFGPHYQEIKSRFGDIRLALLPIGAYEPRWFMSPVHMSPEQAIEAHEILSPNDSIAIHYGTFALADEPQYEPQERIRQLAAEKRLRFHVLDNGQSWTATPVQQEMERII
jgi:L-ascorbate metabolism protein UlaG (beta-lactamase superfamily)